MLRRKPNDTTTHKDNNMKETWKPIELLDNKYEASTLGNIRNARTKKVKAVIFDGHYCKFGYDYFVNGVEKKGWMRVHKAVALTFIPNPENKPTVNHKDGNSKNNAVSNLEWATSAEQSIHASNVLKRHCGESNYNARFTNEEVKDMRWQYFFGGKTISELAAEYRTRRSDMSRILRGDRWKNIGAKDF